MEREKSDELISSIRRIIRAVDVQSKGLLKRHGMTGPQLTVLKEMIESPHLSVSEIAANISLSQATVTNILSRLEHQGLVARKKGVADKRKVYVEATERARKILETKPSILQMEFIEKFNELEDWEQSLLVSSLQRIAGMMDAGSPDRPGSRGRHR